MKAKAKQPLEKRYASLQNPTINAIVNGMYRFTSAREAMAQLARLEQHFVLAKKQIENPAHPSLIFWIRGYAITPEDEKRGILGCYALVTYAEKQGKFTLTATKLDWDHKLDPIRGQVRRENPNWGHPVLRAVRKGKAYPSAQAAQAELDLLHEHFPNVSIPNPGKLYIMIYCADRPAKERMVKFIISVEYIEESRNYRLVLHENQKKPQTRRLTIPKRMQAPQETVGHFTAKLAAKRPRKSKKSEEKPAEE